MDFTSKMNMTSMDFLTGMDINSDRIRSPVLFGFVGFIAAFISFLAYLSYTPRVDKKSPAFTSDTVVFVGSWSFFTRKWLFWKNCVKESKTGNFSFWLNKYHVVGVSGEAARKMYLDDRDLDFVQGATLVGHGPDMPGPGHEIFKPDFHNGRSYFLRRLLELQKSEQLAKRLPCVIRDARAAFEAMAKDSSGVTNPSDACYRIVVTQACRVVCTDEIADNPKLLESCVGYLSILQATSSIHSVAVPWLPSWSYMKRRYGRYGISNLVTPLVENRMKKGAARVDDTLQTFVDNGDRKEHIISFFISILFISTANAGALAGAMLNIMAHHTYWQEKVYGEIKAAARAHCTNKNAPLVEQLDSIPLESWESSFPSIDLCFKEAIRMWVAFPMVRLNMGLDAIPIPGSDEVIPPGSFASYNTTEVHYNEELYPNPTVFDPERFLEGREEFKKQTYSFVGWGQGRHPCMGTRWAKMQQNIILVYAIAMFKWSGCDANGKPNPHFDRKTDLDAPGPSLPQGLYCKHVPREKM